MPSTDLIGGRTCAWVPDEDYTFFTECGEGFQFASDGPEENDFRFCPFCAHRIATAEQ